MRYADEEYWYCVSIPLTQGKHTIIEVSDFESVMRFRWRYNNNGYAVTARSPKPKAMHHIIFAVPAGMTVDHRNRDKLDNRRSNLRICTPQENARNRKKRAGSACPYKGVSINNRDGVWQAKIWLNGKNLHLGTFSNPLAAAEAYNTAAIKHYGEFSLLNVIEE